MPRGPERAGIPEDPAARVIPRRAVRALCARLRREGKRIAFTNGCFDILHAGHAQYLRRAAALGDVLLVGLNDDASVRRLKGPGRPLVPASDRAEVLAAFEMVDRVVVFPEDDPGALIDAVVPDVLVKGADWSLDAIIGRETVERAGGRVVRVQLTSDRSTSALIRTVIERLRGEEAA